MQRADWKLCTSIVYQLIKIQKLTSSPGLYLRKTILLTVHNKTFLSLPCPLHPFDPNQSVEALRKMRESVEYRLASSSNISLIVVWPRNHVLFFLIRPKPAEYSVAVRNRPARGRRRTRSRLGGAKANRPSRPNMHVMCGNHVLYLRNMFIFF